MRHWVGLGLFVCLVLGAVIARAGAFSPPVGFDACATFDIVGDAMSDPNSAYINAETPRQCEQLCKAAGAQCRASVKDSAACYVRILRSFKSFGYKNCEVTYNTASDTRACKQDVSGGVGAYLGKVQSVRDSSLADCADWVATCQATCMPL